jgi:hypothetical protein
MPGGESDSTVLKVHVGRRLLGFTGDVERARYLIPATKREPAQVVQVYERLLQEAEASRSKRRAALLAESESPLYKHFGTYVEALSVSRQIPRSLALIAAYERFQAAVTDSDAELRRAAFGEWGCPLEKHFLAYVAALVEVGRGAEVAALIDSVRPYWEGRTTLLGAAAFKADRLDIAEPLLNELRQTSESFYRFAEMGLLAETWLRQRKPDAARGLLVDCMRRLVVASRESKHQVDRRIHEGEFQQHRQTFVRLFPELGAPELARLGIPEKTVE